MCQPRRLAKHGLRLLLAEEVGPDLLGRTVAGVAVEVEDVRADAMPRGSNTAVVAEAFAT